MSDLLLQVDGLATEFTTEQGQARAVDDVSFELAAEETLGIVGESGCGKSVTALSIMRLLPKPAGRIANGAVVFRGQDLTGLPPEAMHKIRGKRIAMIFQEPMTALNPVYRIGRQLGETLELHHPDMDKAAVRSASLEILAKVGIPAPERRLKEYPHQLSGGMRQRVMIAIALSCQPDILIADEPTTALDVTIQAQILKLMKDLQQETGMAILFITHDLGVIAELCDRVLVMYGGRVVEEAAVEALFAAPRHPYTKGLLEAIPRLDKPAREMLDTIPGMVPSLHDFPPGCRFQNRCGYVEDQCRQQIPLLENINGNHKVRCFRHGVLNG
ncbi:MAG TPA: peptide ABC transporter ATP-binding protein [Gammaproteobacteria bacterium]|nr:peptide ABC transporter ATP-binding protein [Gammaproteobacteria bacterium]